MIGVDDAVGVKQLVLADVVDAEVVPGSDLDQPARSAGLPRRPAS